MEEEGRLFLPTRRTTSPCVFWTAWRGDVTLTVQVGREAFLLCHMVQHGRQRRSAHREAEIRLNVLLVKQVQCDGLMEPVETDPLGLLLGDRPDGAEPRF